MRKKSKSSRQKQVKDVGAYTDEKKAGLMGKNKPSFQYAGTNKSAYLKTNRKERAAVQITGFYVRKKQAWQVERVMQTGGLILLIAIPFIPGSRPFMMPVYAVNSVRRVRRTKSKIGKVAVLTMATYFVFIPMAQAMSPGKWAKAGQNFGFSLGHWIGEKTDIAKHREAALQHYHDVIRRTAYEFTRDLINFLHSRDVLNDRDLDAIVGVTNRALNRPSPRGKIYESSLHELNSRLKTGFESWNLLDTDFKEIAKSTLQIVDTKGRAGAEALRDFLHGLIKNAEEFNQQQQQATAVNPIWWIPIIIIMIRIISTTLGVPF